MDVRPKRFWILIGCTAVLPVLYVLVWVTGGTHNAWTTCSTYQLSWLLWP